MSADQNNELVAQLKQLQVQMPALDRDRLLYQAGQRSVKQGWVWPAVSGLCMILALSSFLFRPPAEHMVKEQALQLATESKSVILPEASSEPFLRGESQSYLAALKELVENKPWRSTANYDSVKPDSIQTAGSYLQWFRQ